MPAKSKSKTRKPAQASGQKLSNVELLRLAQRHKPPQQWYDEGINPFKPKAFRDHE